VDERSIRISGARRVVGVRVMRTLARVQMPRGRYRVLTLRGVECILRISIDMSVRMCVIGVRIPRTYIIYVWGGEGAEER